MPSRIKSKLRQWDATLEQGHHLDPVRVEEMDEHVCLNCHTTYKGDFCPRCGQSARTGRLTIKEGLENVTAGILKFNKGMSHTIVELVYRPGYMAYDYVHGYRKEYYPPVGMLLILVAFVLFLCSFLPATNSNLMTVVVSFIDALFTKVSWMKKPMEIINEALLTPSIRTLVVAIISVPLIWLAFRGTKVGKKINWAETFYLSVLISCNKLVWIVLFFPLEILTHWLTGSTFSQFFLGGGMSLSSDAGTDIGKTAMTSNGDIVDYLAFFLMIWITRCFYKTTWLSATLRVILFYVLMAVLMLLPFILDSVLTVFDPHATQNFYMHVH